MANSQNPLYLLVLAQRPLKPPHLRLPQPKPLHQPQRQRQPHLPQHPLPKSPPLVLVLVPVKPCTSKFAWLATPLVWQVRLNLATKLLGSLALKLVWKPSKPAPSKAKMPCPLKVVRVHRMQIFTQPLNTW